MIILMYYRKHFLTLTYTVAGLFLIMFSISILFADEEITDAKIIKGINSGSSSEVKEIIRENSIMNEYLLEVEGVASHYGKRFHKRKTASGERYDMKDYSAAHKNLPFGTILKVTNVENSKSTFVRVNDRGPFIRKRILDLSFRSADEIDGTGLANIKIEGFVKGKVEIPANNGEDYFFAYSITNKPMIIPAKFLEIRHTFSDFNETVEHYNELVSAGILDSNVTFIVFDNDTFDGFSEKDVFSIATWRPILYRRIPVMMAEKVYKTN